MSLFGKILAILNVLAALAFGYLALLDYAKRQHWAYAVYRHDLRLQGLPVTDEQTDLQGYPLAANLDDRTLREVLGGEPVTSQVKEVERVRGQLQAKINGPAIKVSNPLDPKSAIELTTRVQKLAWALRPFASTADRREELDRLMNSKDDNKQTADRLQNDLNKEFDVVPNAGRDLESSRRAIAHVLFSAAELSVDEKTEPGKERDLINNPDYRRALAVVGLEAARWEMDDEAHHYERITRAIQTAMTRDREQFVQQHQLLYVRLLEAADELAERTLERDRERDKVQAHEDLLAQRRKQVKELEAKLAERQAATRKLLQEQAKLEQQLFRSQQEFRDATEENFKLEQEIRNLEKGR
jgi:chromosome segregation ATPase